MYKVIFDKFCDQRRCQHFVQWDVDVGADRPYWCSSCTLVGQSYEIDMYPHNCLHLEDIKKYEEAEQMKRTWEILTS